MRARWRGTAPPPRRAPANATARARAALPAHPRSHARAQATPTDGRSSCARPRDRVASATSSSRNACSRAGWSESVYAIRPTSLRSCASASSTRASRPSLLPVRDSVSIRSRIAASSRSRVWWARRVCSSDASSAASFARGIGQHVGLAFRVHAVVRQLLREPRRDCLRQRSVRLLRERFDRAFRIRSRAQHREPSIAVFDGRVDAGRQGTGRLLALVAEMLEIGADRGERGFALRALDLQPEAGFRNDMRQHACRSVEQTVVGDERAWHAAAAALTFAEIVKPQRQRLLGGERLAFGQRSRDLDRPAHDDRGADVEVGRLESLAPERRGQR